MFDLIIIGGGPAGMMTGINTINKKVLLIDKNNRLGKKMLLTGGGRCNVLNMKTREKFVNELPRNNRFINNLLKQVDNEYFYNYFEENGLSLKVEDNDRAFPVSNKARDVVEFLEKKLLENKVQLNLVEEVLEVKKVSDYFLVTTNKDSYKAKKVAITTGGITYPNTGSTGDGHRFAKEFDHEITSLAPSECYLIIKDKLNLAGITLDKVVIKLNDLEKEGSLLFTHNGLSGPAAFRISEEVYRSIKTGKNPIIKVDLLPDYKSEDLILKMRSFKQNKEVFSFLKEYLPKRLIEELISSEITSTFIGSLSKIKKEELFTTLKNYPVEVIDTAPFAIAFVTSGGVSLEDIDNTTLESKKTPGLYFGGEVLDIHGHTGGYNITLAFTTGYIIGKNN